MIEINRRRLRADVAALAAIGRDDATGAFQRAAGSAAIGHAREWCARRLASAGIAMDTDSAGNFAARVDGAPHASAAVIHAPGAAPDGAGPLAAALGIVTGIECLRRAREIGDPAMLPSVLLVGPRDPPSTADLAFALADRALSLQLGVQSGAADYATADSPVLGLIQRGYAAAPLARFFAAAADLALDLFPVEEGEADVESQLDAAPTCLLVIPRAVDTWPPTDLGWAYAEASANLILNAACGVR